jgi:hypothetical protein
MNFKNLLVRVYECQKKMNIVQNLIREMEAIGKPTDVYRRNLKLLEKDLRSSQMELRKSQA